MCLSRARSSAALVLALVAAFVAAVTWTFAGFISGRLTNGLLVLGLFTLFGAFHAFRPFGRRRDDVPTPPGGWRWRLSYAYDALYYTGPAWLVTLLFAMRALDVAGYAIPFAAAYAGAAGATFLAARRADVLPDAPPLRGHEAPRSMRALAVAYGAAGVLMLAGNLGVY